MPYFSPSIKITSIPRTSAHFKLEDSSTTYGLTAGPASTSDILRVGFEVQLTGAASQTVPDSLVEGNINDGFTVNYALQDGVHIVRALFGTDFHPGQTPDYVLTTVSGSNGLKIHCDIQTVGSDFEDVFSNVTHIADLETPAVLRKIKALDITNKIIELYEAFPAPLDGKELTKSYTAQVRLLILNKGEGDIIKDISNMAINHCGCDPATSKELIDRILLKLAAQTAFSCGNYAKAHNAALLLNKNNGNQTSCTTC